MLLSICGYLTGYTHLHSFGRDRVNTFTSVTVMNPETLVSMASRIFCSLSGRIYCNVHSSSGAMGVYGVTFAPSAEDLVFHCVRENIEAMLKDGSSVEEGEGVRFERS